MAETACPGSCFCLCSSVVRACIVCWFTQCLVMFAHICSSVNGPRAAPKVEYSILEISVPRHSQRSVAPSWLCRVPCYWKKLWPKWTKIHKSINFLPNIKSDVRCFSYTMQIMEQQKKAKFYSYGTFLGPKRLKNDEKWLNFAFHFSDDPE